MVELVQLVSADGRTPSSAAAWREAEQALHIAIAGLPEDYREVIRLRHMEGLGIEAVAAAMDRPHNVIRGLLYRARKKLRDAMDRVSLWLSKG